MQVSLFLQREGQPQETSDGIEGWIQKNVKIHPYPNKTENGISKTEFTMNVTTMNVTTQLITKKEMEVPDSKLSFIYVFINLCLACDRC